MKTLPAILAAAVLLAGCTAPVEPADIATASYPATFLVEELAPASLRTVDLAGGAALHDFEPSARDLDQLRQTTHLILWDEALESWAHRAEERLGSSGPALFEATALPAGEHYLEGDDAHDHGHGHGPHHDPHTWNDPLAMRASLDAVAEYLEDAYPEHADEIHARHEALSARLDALHTLFEAGLKDCRHDVVITNHEAHAYLAARYGFDLVTLHGLTPGSEPSPATIERIIQTIRDHGLPVVFVEEGTPARALKAIQDETGVEIGVLDTLENRPATGDYIKVQEGNLAELRTALDCS